MATIVKHEKINGTSYQVRYRIGIKQRTKTFKTRPEATKFKKQIEAQNTLGVSKDETHVTFGEYSLSFMMIHTEDLKETTQDNYNHILGDINKEMGHLKMKDITPIYLDKYLVKLSRKYKYNTIRIYKRVLNMVFKSAAKKDKIKSNPMDKLDFVLKNREEEKNRLVSADEYRYLLQYFEKLPKYKYVVMMANLTGIRKGELLALRWANVDFEKRILYVKDNLNKNHKVTTPKTKSSIRMVPIHNLLFETLHEIKERQKYLKYFYGKSYIDNDLVLPDDTGAYIRISTINQAFQYMHDRTDLKVTLHDFRHTFATKMRGSETKDVQQILGHKKIETTDSYTHHDEFKSETLAHLNKIYK